MSFLFSDPVTLDAVDNKHVIIEKTKEGALP